MKIKNTRRVLALAKAGAARAKEALERMHISVSHSQALEVTAAVHGHANWHAYRAHLLRAPVAPPATYPVSPFATGLQALGSTPAAVKGQLGESEQTVKLYEVALYASNPAEAPSQFFLAQDSFLATSETDAHALMRETHWDARLETTGHAPTMFVEGVYDVTEPSTEALVAWLQGNVVDSSDLDEWVIEMAVELRLTEVNLTAPPDEQVSGLSAAERAAAEIKNGGLTAQLEFLRKRYQRWEEFVNSLRERLGLMELPSFD